MHKDWCGNPCDECQSPCKLDESIPCSPDCEYLGPNGEVDRPACQGCGARFLYDEEFPVTCDEVTGYVGQGKKPDFTNHTGDDYPN